MQCSSVRRANIKLPPPIPYVLCCVPPGPELGGMLLIRAAGRSLKPPACYGSASAGTYLSWLAETDMPRANVE